MSKQTITVNNINKVCSESGPILIQKYIAK